MPEGLFFFLSLFVLIRHADANLAFLIDETYVKEIQAKICENAAAEYTCIAHEYKRNGGATPRSIISDQLSTNLNDLQTELEHSDLYDNEKSRLAVLKKALPVTLVKQIGVDELVKRLPEPVSG